MAKTAVVFSRENLVATCDAEGILTIQIDTTKRLRPSRPTTNKDGTLNPPKSMIIGTSGGNQPVTLADGTTFRLGLTAYVENPKNVVA